MVHALAYLGAAAASFLMISAIHVLPLLAGAGAASDKYFYFDALIDPGYFAMWRSDLPGNVGLWPPPGELGGVGLFTLLLAAGLGVALMIAWDQLVVRVAVACLTSAFVLRFWFASRMYGSGTVQLWPRTTAAILYCLLVASSVGVATLARPWARRLAESDPMPSRGDENDRVRPQPARRLAWSMGALAAAALVLGASASAIADRYFPRDDNSTGRLAWIAHTQPLIDGSCPSRAPEGSCTPRP
jgi:galactan 5-O-arabinofuranosyltransferase